MAHISAIVWPVPIVAGERNPIGARGAGMLMGGAPANALVAE